MELGVDLLLLIEFFQVIFLPLLLFGFDLLVHLLQQFSTVLDLELLSSVKLCFCYGLEVIGRPHMHGFKLRGQNFHRLGV